MLAAPAPVQTTRETVADIVRTHGEQTGNGMCSLLAESIERMGTEPRRLVYTRTLLNDLAPAYPALVAWVRQQLRM